MRLLFWLGLLVLVVLAIRKKAQPLARSSENVMPQPVSVVEAEDMLCCAHCQVYFPASEAVQRHDQVFCSSAHADLH